MARELTYVTHFCKNRSCNWCWLDIDLTNAQSPPRWKYCSKCLNKGYINPKKPPKNETLSHQALTKWQKGKLRGRPKKVITKTKISLKPH